MVHDLLDLKNENAGLRMAANRRSRAASGSELPGFTPDRLERITRTAEDFGAPYQLAAAVYQVENGGDFLDVGIQALPPFVNQQVKDPSDQQFAALAVQINEEAGKWVLADPERRSQFVDVYAARHNDPSNWHYALDLHRTLDAFMDAGHPTTSTATATWPGSGTRLKGAHKVKRRKR